MVYIVTDGKHVKNLYMSDVNRYGKWWTENKDEAKEFHEKDANMIIGRLKYNNPRKEIIS